MSDWSYRWAAGVLGASWHYPAWYFFLPTRDKKPSCGILLLGSITEVFLSGLRQIRPLHLGRCCSGGSITGSVQ